MSEVLQSPDHPAIIKLSEMYTSEDNKKQSPYSVETPYGFCLDLDFLKYVDDIEKGNTIKKVYIHKKAKQPKYSTLPRNFSVTDTQFSSSDSRSYRKYGDKGMTTSSWASTNRCKGANIKELFKSALSNHEPALLQSNMHDCRSGKTLSDAKESLGENGLSSQSCPKPSLLRACSVPVDFKELSFEEQHQILSTSQQKLKLSENYGFRHLGNALVREKSNTPEVAPQLNVTLPQVHQLQQQISIAQDESKEMEKQINIISELKQQVLVLQEEKKQLLLQLKNQQQNAKPTSSPVLERKATVAAEDCVTTGTQCNSSATHLRSETVEQTLFPSKSTTYEVSKSNETFQSENVTNLNHQINFASKVTASINKNLDFSIHKEKFQNSSEDIENRKRDVGVQVTIGDLRMVLVPHHSTERVSIKESKNTFSRLENQVKGGAHELEVEHEGIDPSKYTQNRTKVCDTSNQIKIQSNLGTTEPELGTRERNESEQICKHDIKSDLQPVIQSVNCGYCSVNMADTNLIETRSFGINTDFITVSDAVAVATVETRETATNTTVSVCSKAVETEHDSYLHCICHGTNTFSKGNKEDTVMCEDSGDDNFNGLSNTKTCSADGNSAVKGNRKECLVALESQHNICKKDNSQDAVYALLQPDSQIISTKPELAQSIKKIEDLLCKQQSFLELNYPDLAQNFKKLCSSIGNLSIQLINSLQPWTSSLPKLEQSDRSSTVKECEPAVSQPTSLKSIMKKNSGNIKSRAPSAKKYLQFTGVNGGYETTSSEDSNSTEGGSDSDLEKECVNTRSQIQHSDNKPELVKDAEETRYEEIQPSASDATVTVLPHSTKSHNSKQSLFLACQNLKDHLSELGATNVRQNLNTIQWEWFRMSSQKSAASDRVQAFLQELQEMSPELLHFIVNLADDNQNTALHYSVSHSNFHVVRHLLDTGMCNVDCQNKAGYTATMLASLASAETDEDLAVVMQLLHLGNVNIQASQAGQTALMLAVCHGRIDMAKALLSSGANVNIQDTDGSTALMCASEHGHVEMVKLLLAQPECNSALTDKDGSTALNIALQAGQKDIAELLSLHMNSGISPTL